MNFQEAIASCFKNYATFKGRAARSEYWYFFLFCMLGKVLANIVDVGVLGVPAHALHPLAAAFALITLVPSLAVIARRLHDVNRSGWWVLIAFTIIGIIPLLIWYCTKGTDGDNEYGADPLR